MNIRLQNLDSRLQLIPTKFWRLVSNILFLLASSIYLLTSFAPMARAQSVGLSISPPVVEILIAPNKKVIQTFTLQTTGEDLEITPELHLAKPSDELGHMTIDPNPINPNSIPLTFTISQNGPVYTLTLESTSTDITQDVYLALVFRTSPLESNVSNLTSLSPSISALVLTTLTPTGIIPAALEITGFDLPLFHDSSQPFTIQPTLTNYSEIMIRPEGHYEVIDPRGKTVLDLPLYPNLILGNSSRLLTSNISNLASDLTWIPKWSNLGPHRLRLTVTTIGGTKLTEVEKVVWFLPIRLIVLGIALLICVLAIFLSRNKHKSNTLPIDNP